ncbi:hypothetical protein AZSI13_33530 [Azospira sp. I13]|nr:hypothetical protein AZSI13_33530 [Azospira sp. I13]
MAKTISRRSAVTVLRIPIGVALPPGKALGELGTAYPGLSMNPGGQGSKECLVGHAAWRRAQGQATFPVAQGVQGNRFGLQAEFEAGRLGIIVGYSYRMTMGQGSRGYAQAQQECDKKAEREAEHDGHPTGNGSEIARLASGMPVRPSNR